MKIETWFLINLTDTKPNRELGNLKELKRSIEEIGLICPLAIDENGKLLAGRRRYKALMELGWEEVSCVVYPAGDDALALRVTIDENQRHKPYTEPEAAAFVKQYDEVMRERAKNELLLADNKKSESKPAHRPKEAWTQEKTAEALGISQPTVAQSIKIAEHVEDHPEDAKLKGKQILKKITEEKKTKTIEKKATLSKLSEEETKQREDELREGLEAFKSLPRVVGEVLGSRYTDDAQILEDKLYFYMTRVEWHVVLKAVRKNLKNRPHYPTSVAIKTLTKTVRAAALKVNKDFVFEEGGDRIYRLVEAALKELAIVTIEDESVPTSERVYKIERLKK
jgi:ParB family chromosome partitioning protein